MSKCIYRLHKINLVMLSLNSRRSLSETENIEMDRLRQNKYAVDLSHNGIWKYLASRIEVLHIYLCVDGLTNLLVTAHTITRAHISQTNTITRRASLLGRAKSQTRLRSQVNTNVLMHQSLTCPIPNQGFQRYSQGGCDSENGWRKCNYATLKQNQIAKVCI